MPWRNRLEQGRLSKSPSSLGGCRVTAGRKPQRPSLALSRWLRAVPACGRGRPCSELQYDNFPRFQRCQYAPPENCWANSDVVRPGAATSRKRLETPDAAINPRRPILWPSRGVTLSASQADRRSCQPLMWGRRSVLSPSRSIGTPSPSSRDRYKLVNGVPRLYRTWRPEAMVPPPRPATRIGKSM